MIAGHVFDDRSGMVSWSEDKQQALVPALENVLGRDNVLLGEPLCKHTTFAIGGPADVYAIPQSIEDLARIHRVCSDTLTPMRILGKGSDLLVADSGMRGVVVQVLGNLSEITIDGNIIRAQAGATNSEVAQAALQAGLSGFEFAAGIPGTIGGAAIMNAGAYGGEFRDVCIELTCIDSEGDFVTVSRDDAEWSYRHSMMSEEGYVVAEAVLELAPADPEEIKATMDDLQARREEKQPLEMPSAGSTFKRPEGYFAGKLIQDAGLQGASVGGAQVSTKHAGFVVNAGNASAADVLGLIRHVQETVKARFGVDLEPEVRMWGFQDGE